MYFPSTTHLIEFLRAIKSHVVEKYLMTWKQCSWHMDKWQKKKKTHHKVRAAESKLCERCVYIWLWKEGKIWKHIVVFFYFAFLHPSAPGPGMITDAKRKIYSLAFDIQNRHLYLRWAWKLGTGKRGSFSTSVALHKGLQGREMGDFREKKLCLQSGTDHGQTEPFPSLLWVFRAETTVQGKLKARDQQDRDTPDSSKHPLMVWTPKLGHRQVTAWGNQAR